MPSADPHLFHRLVQAYLDCRRTKRNSASAQAFEAMAEPTDPLYTKAVQIITQAQKASVRLLKDELGIGTTKAMDLMQLLEAAGKVSPTAERGARKVLVTA